MNAETIQENTKDMAEKIDNLLAQADKLAETIEQQLPKQPVISTAEVEARQKVLDEIIAEIAARDTERAKLEKRVPELKEQYNTWCEKVEADYSGDPESPVYRKAEEKSVKLAFEIKVCEGKIRRLAADIESKERERVAAYRSVCNAEEAIVWQHLAPVAERYDRLLNEIRTTYPNVSHFYQQINHLRREQSDNPEAFTYRNYMGTANAKLKDAMYLAGVPGIAAPGSDQIRNLKFADIVELQQQHRGFTGCPESEAD